MVAKSEIDPKIKEWLLSYANLKPNLEQPTNQAVPFQKNEQKLVETPKSTTQRNTDYFSDAEVKMMMTQFLSPNFEVEKRLNKVESMN